MAQGDGPRSPTRLTQNAPGAGPEGQVELTRRGGCPGWFRTPSSWLDANPAPSIEFTMRPTRVLLLPLLAALTVALAACAPLLQPTHLAPTDFPTPASYTQSSESAGFSGNSGTVETFSLMGGTYVIDESAAYDASNDPSRSGKCFFAGELDNLATGTKSALGSSSPVLASAPLTRTTSATFSSGTFHLSISSKTTCDWDVTIVQNGG